MRMVAYPYAWYPELLQGAWRGLATRGWTLSMREAKPHVARDFASGIPI